MNSELIAVLEKEVSAEVERILNEARAQADQILADAGREAEALREDTRRRIEAERKAAQTRAQSAAQLKASSQVLRAKDAAIAEVFERAHAELARAGRDRAAYARLLHALIKEASAELSGRVIVTVNPSDVDGARQAARELGLDAEIATSPDVSGGVVVSTPDGRFIVQNTLASRLERVKPTLATDVANLLWGR